MSSSAFNPRLGLWFSLSAAVSLTLAIVLYLAMTSTAKKSAMVEESQEALHGLRTVMAKYDEAIIAVRGFSHAKEEKFIDVYRRNMRDVAEAFDRLGSLEQLDRGQRDRLIRLRQLVDKRGELIDQMLAVHRAEDLMSAMKYGKARGLDQMVAQIWATITELEAEQKRQLSAQVQTVSRASRLTFGFFAVGIAGNLVIIALAFLYMARQVNQRAAAEATLRRSEERFRGTFEAAAVGMGVLSLDGKWLQVNPALCAILDYTEEELLATDHRAITHPDDPATDLARVGESSEGSATSRQEEKRYIHKAGHVVYVSVSGSVVRGDLGRATTIVALIEDITAKKRAEARLAAQHAVALVLAESKAFAEAIPSLLAAIGQALGFSTGEYWELDELTDRLQAAEDWWSTGRIDPEFSRSSRHVRFAPGEGLVGMVWQLEQPVVMEDVGTNERFVRTAAARKAGLRGAFGIPLVGTAGPIGVMTFLSEEKAYDDEALRASLFTIGRQIGLFVERRRAEEIARATERRFRAIFDNTQEFMGLLDPQANLLEANRAALEFSGSSREEVIGTPFCDSPWWKHDEALREKLRAGIERAKQGEIVRFEADHIGRDGSMLSVDFSLTPVKDESGQVVLLVPEGHDITKVKRTAEALRDSEERFRLLVEGVRDHSILMLNPSGYIANWNAAAMAMTGFDAEETIGRHFSVFNSGDEVKTGDWDEQLTIARDLGRWEGEGWRKRKDGSLFWADVLISPVKDGEGRLLGFANVMRDVTERRQTEEDLRKAKEAAEAANRAKGEFLANMSHEIRTPMNGILGMTELALETELTPQQSEYLRLVQSSADALLTVINDILDFSKIDAGKMELSPSEFAFKRMVEETVRALAPRVNGKGLTLECAIAPEIPEMLLGDAGRLRQIIVNLLGNSIKFTQRGGIVVRADLVRGGDAENVAEIHVSISDTGVGIKQEKLAKIFEPFEQEDNSTTRRFGGTGLGLAISGKLVELMGGRIWVESEVGRGSTFHFTARLERAANVTESKVAGGGNEHSSEMRNWVDRAARNGSHSRNAVAAGLNHGVAMSGELNGERKGRNRARVLVAEDHPVNQKLATRLLENAGHDVTLVENGMQAVEAVEAGDFDLVLMDVQMPVMGGFEAIARIRMMADETKSRMPAIALTAHAMKGDRERCLEAGFDGYLSKPINGRSLTESVKSFLSLGAEAKERAQPQMS